MIPSRRSSAAPSWDCEPSLSNRGARLGCLLSDPRLYQIYEKCVGLDLTVIPQTSGPLGGKNIDYANPKYVEQVAEDFPDLRIICGHGHYPYVREAITMCTRRDNVYLSPDIYLRQLGTEDRLKAINENIGAYFGGFGLADRFVFGSAYPLFDLKEYIRFFFSLPWKPEVLSRILYKKRAARFESARRPGFSTDVRAGVAGRKDRSRSRVSEGRRIGLYALEEKLRRQLGKFLGLLLVDVPWAVRDDLEHGALHGRSGPLFAAPYGISVAVENEGGRVHLRPGLLHVVAHGGLHGIPTPEAALLLKPVHSLPRLSIQVRISSACLFPGRQRRNGNIVGCRIGITQEISPSQR